MPERDPGKSTPDEMINTLAEAATTYGEDNEAKVREAEMELGSLKK